MFDRSFGSLVFATSVLSLLGTARGSINEDGFGFRASSDVTNTLNLALDVLEMRLASDDVVERQRVYEDGGNAQPATLALLSVVAADDFGNSPMYNLYRHYFDVIGRDREGDSDHMFDGEPVDTYGNTLVEDLFQLGVEHIEAEGAVVYNVLMAFWGFLFNMLDACKRNDADSTADMFGFLDQAAALWVGAEQERGDEESGYMLYNLAESVGGQFGQDQGVTRLNQFVLGDMTLIQEAIQSGECATGEDGYDKMHKMVELLVIYSNTLLVQKLLHHVEDSAATAIPDFVELYALAILPQIHPCDVGLHDKLFDLTVTQDINPDDKPVVIETIQEAYSCLQIQCSDVGAYLQDKIPQCPNEPTEFRAMAGYQPTSDVREFATIDRDINYIEIFMHYGAWQEAAEFYKHGWNSQFSLREFTRLSRSVHVSHEAELYKTYYDDQTFDYLDSVILNTLEAQAPFDNVPDGIRSSMVLVLLRNVVTFLSMSEELHRAIDGCQDGIPAETNQEHWDKGAAFFIGSGEGAVEGGQEGGSLLFATAADLCESFNTCNVDGSIAGRGLINQLRFASGKLAEDLCAEADEVLENAIIPTLQTILLQGLLVSAGLYQESGASAQDLVGPIFAYSRAIQPLINDVCPACATTIEGNTNSNNFPTLSVNFGAIRESVVTYVDRLTTPDCEELGELTVSNIQYGFCVNDQPVPLSPTVDADNPDPPAITPAPSPASDVYVPEPHPLGLAWGLYTFNDDTVADNDAKFSLDVKAMHMANSVDEARAVYGKVNGNVVGGLSGDIEVDSLADFSVAAAKFMGQDPMYNFFRVALYSDDVFENQKTLDEGWLYADEVVNLALSPSNGNDPELGAESAVVLNVWMFIVHRLYEAVRVCAGGHDASSLIDSAVALWIGEEQGAGKFNSGWMLYAAGQEAYQKYGHPEGEAPTNTNLMTVFNMAQDLAEDCAVGSDSFLDLRLVVNELIRELSKPLLQLLLYYISEDRYKYVELYALSFIPQAISCDINAFEYLRDAFINNSFVRDTTVNEELMGNMGKVLHCLRFTCTDLGDTANASEQLKNLVSSLCEQIQGYDTNLMASYETRNDVSELARLDLDIHQIDLFMRVEAYEAAEECYNFGCNSEDPDGAPVSLKSLARPEYLSQAGVLNDMYTSYFDSATYIDTLVEESLDPGVDTRFSQASRRQLSEAATRTLQAMMSYFLVVGRLNSVIEQCGTASDVLRTIDEAAALFIGSIEGPYSGGSNGSGRMLYALGKEFCEDFGKCERLGDSAGNQFLIFAFSNLQDAVDEGDCATAVSIINDSILKMLPVALIQGTISSAAKIEGLPPRAQNMTLMTGSILAEAMLPQVFSVNQTSASIINENMEFNLDVQPVSGGAAAVVNAFGSVMEALDIDCNFVGTLDGLSTCAAPSSVDTPTSLGGDLYITTTYVEDRASIALDIEQIEDALAGGNIDLAERVYSSGQNSKVYNSFGVETGLRTLEGFSTDAVTTMTTNPLYHTAVFALRDSSGQYRGQPAGAFADTIVKESLAYGRVDSSKALVAAEAVVALNLWMEVANELYDTVAKCKSNSIVDTDGVHSIDEAAAYWFGEGTDAGNAERGHLLYAYAEKMGDFFGLTDSGQSRTNTNMVNLLNQAKNEVAVSNACVDDPDTARRIRNIVDQIASQMVAVQIQALIHSIRSDDRPRVRVYAHGFVPLVAACNPTSFEYLKSNLIDSEFPQVDADNIIRVIRGTLPCFDLQCEDLGIHNTENPSVCIDPDPLTSLAGYKPVNDVREFAQIDLDILEMDILLEMGAVEAATEIYEYGKHATDGVDDTRRVISLKSLATSPDRSVVPQFVAFRQYKDSGENYADNFVKFALNQSSDIAPVQRRVMAVFASRYIILYMSALQAMTEAVEICEANSDGKATEISERWDQAAAYIIGSLEGWTEDGSGDGQLIWALAKQSCEEFGTCSSEVFGLGRVNDDIVTLLFAGRGAILGGACAELDKATSELGPILLIPMIQGALSVSQRLAGGRGSDEDKVTGFMLAEAVLPLIQASNPDAAAKIDNFFELSTSYTQSGADDVAMSYSKSLQGLGIECEDVGASTEVDACSGTRSSSSNAGVVIGMIVVILTVLGLGWLAIRIYKLKKRERNAPVFVKKNGELNHHSDFLSSRPEEARHGSEMDSFLKGDADAAMEEDSPYHDPLAGGRAPLTKNII